MGLLLLIKLVAGPLLIGLTSLAGRFWGPRISGLLAGLPSLALVITALIWYTHGEAFALEVMRQAPNGLWANAIYMLTMAWAARRMHWLAVTVLALLVYLASAVLIVITGLSHAKLFGLLGLIVFILLPGLLPDRHTEALHLPNSELVTRMLVSIGLIWALSTIAPLFGSSYSGVFAAFPVASLVLPAFTLALYGEHALISQLRGFAHGLQGFAICFLLWPVLVPPLQYWAILPAMLAAVFGTMALHKLPEPNWIAQR